MKVRILTEAKLEFAESALYYFEESPMIAGRFTDEIEKAFEEVSAHPLRYREAQTGIRVKVLESFPFNIYYEIINDEIVILAISHQARMPDHWLDRT